jgi:hypothetical protein
MAARFRGFYVVPYVAISGIKLPDIHTLPNVHIMYPYACELVPEKDITNLMLPTKETLKKTSRSGEIATSHELNG